MTAVKQSNVHTLALFGIVALSTIASLGALNRNGSPKKEPRLEELQEWSRSGTGDEIKERFASIRVNAGKWDRRWHLWYIPSLLVAACQATIFGIAIYPLFRDLGVPKFMLRYCISTASNRFTELIIGLVAITETTKSKLPFVDCSFLSSLEGTYIFPVNIYLPRVLLSLVVWANLFSLVGLPSILV